VAPWYVMIELADSSEAWDPQAGLEQVLEEAMEQALVTDAVIASSDSQSGQLWALRHNVSESNVHAGFSVPTDTSVPVSSLPAFLEKVTSSLLAELPACRVVHCGHAGDGNIHVVAILDRDRYASIEAREAAAARVNAIAYTTCTEFGGSISAEHGIGMSHVGELEAFKPAIDLSLMKALKHCFDPANLMNPGKVVGMNG